MEPILEIAINICYLISMYSALCILLGTTIYVFISYILTHAEHFSKQIGSVKEKLRQCYKRGFKKGMLLRDQLGQYMTDPTLLRDQLGQYMTNLVRSKRTCKNPQSDFLLDKYRVGLIPGQHALFKAVRNIIPKSLRESYRRVIYTLPTPTTQTIPTLEQVKGFLTVQVFLAATKEKNRTGTKDIFNKNDDWTETTFFKDIISEYDNPDYKGLSNWEIDCEVREENKRKQEKKTIAEREEINKEQKRILSMTRIVKTNQAEMRYKKEMQKQPPNIFPCRICRSQ